MKKQNLTWDNLAEIYDKEVGGRRARTLPMNTIFSWAKRQKDKFHLNTDGTLSLTRKEVSE